MIATSHVIIGGTIGLAVGTATQNPILAFAAGVVSHVLCDLIPHIDHPPEEKDSDGDLKFTKKVYIFAITDSVIAFLITLFLWIQFFNFPAITSYPLGALGGYLPDFIDNIPWWRKQIREYWILKQFHKFHQDIHNVWLKRFPMPENWLLGSITQIITVGLCIIYLF
ncbi:MAG TPA: hypothetical protein VD998_00195 [Verrucomicrobiae bacterium]|nr:hypothetical protein [Verrucomicrobiae bacterium]